MAKDQLRDLHLFAIESALPFGMGIIQNAKKGGFQKVMDKFNNFNVVNILIFLNYSFILLLISRF